MDRILIPRNVAANWVVSTIHAPNNNSALGVSKAADCPRKVLLVVLVKLRILSVAGGSLVVDNELLRHLLRNELINGALTVSFKTAEKINGSVSDVHRNIVSRIPMLNFA